MPEPALSGLHVLFTDRREDRFAGHEGTEDFARVADIVRFHPIERAGQPPKIIAAKGRWRLRSFNPDGRGGIERVGGLPDGIERGGERDIHVGTKIAPRGLNSIAPVA